MAESASSFTRPTQRARRHLHRFHGGLRLPAHCEQTAATPISHAGIPPQLVQPLQQHIGAAATCLVRSGERVLRGQLLAQQTGRVSANLHAPTSGRVLAIEERPVPHPSGLAAPCVVIETDGKDNSGSSTSESNWQELSPAELRKRIREAGIVGLGGAGFPTGVKLASEERPVELLVINGVECEPYIACDNRLMQERAAAVLEGVRILQRAVSPAACMLAIEDGMGAAEAALQAELERNNDTGIELVRVPEIYPSGGERQLIRVLTGREVPSQGFPADIGIICQNVGTAVAVYDAVVRQQPLLSRIVTVTGEGVAQPQNIEALLGTPVSYLIERAGGYTPQVERLLIGGPMMGYAVSHDNIPVIKTMNCVLAVTHAEMPPPPPAEPCIRCGKCTTVCPADLLPQQLYWYARSDNLDAAQDYNLFDCIECGCCAHVCPSHIPLVQYYRHAKTEIWAREAQTRASDLARQRHEARLSRLDRIKQERAARMAQKKKSVAGTAAADDKKAAIEAALQRVKRKKEQAGMAMQNTDNLTAEQQQLIDEADRRRRQQQTEDD